MEKTLYWLASTCIDIIIRFLTKDSESYVMDGVLDIARLSKKICNSLLEQKSLNHNLEEFCLSFAERLSESSFFDGADSERAEAIIKKVIEDIGHGIILDDNTVEMLLSDKDLTDKIREATLKDLCLWSEKEQGIYNNCLRFSVDAISNFIKKMPNYTNEALKVLYQRDSKEFEALGEELQSIIDILNSQKNTVEKYRDYEIDYLRKINIRYKDVRLFGAGLVNRNMRKYEIYTSYIELYCMNVKDEMQDVPIRISDIFDASNYVWLSGEPGGGKTTFIQWLAVNTANQKSDYLKGLVPIVIPLRQVSRFPIDFHEELNHLMGKKCPEGWIEYLFKNNKALLLFDGVDELSMNQREHFYDFVEELVLEWEYNEATNNKMVITSRPYITDELKFNCSKYKLLRMNSSQIERFIRYWHRTIVSQIDDDNREADCIADKLVEAINNTPIIKRIAGTPLLCAMICTVNYSNNGYMPANKNELYDKCCVMLIDSRDKEREIETKEHEACNRLNYTKKELLLELIAKKMLLDETVEIQKSKLVNHLRKFLKENTIVSDELRESPGLLLDYFVQRTGMLMEPSAGRIVFVHKTFMEYLVGKELARTHDLKHIVRNSINPFWKEAIIMSFNQLGPGDSYKLLKQFIDLHDKNQSDEYIFMASLCMDNSNIIKDDIRNRIRNTIKQLIPPSDDNSYELVSCAGYIIPFLSDDKTYTPKERHRCIRLLRTIITDREDVSKELLEDAVTMLMTYFHKGISFIDLCLIALTVDEISESLDEKYEIEKKLYRVISEELVNGPHIRVSINMLNLIGDGNYKIDKEDRLLLTNELTITNHFDTYDFRFLANLDNNCIEWLSRIKSLTIYSSCQSTYDIIDYTPELEVLSLIFGEADDVLGFISKKPNCKKIKRIEYTSHANTYICNRDFERFEGLEAISLILFDERLEFELDDWGIWKKLKEVCITVPKIVYLDLKSELKIWMERNPHISFRLSYIDINRDLKSNIQLFSLYDVLSAKHEEDLECEW